MAKGVTRGPSKADQLKWQAEDIVRQAMKDSPAFKRAVRQTIADLKRTQAKAVKQMRKK